MLIFQLLYRIHVYSTLKTGKNMQKSEHGYPYEPDVHDSDKGCPLNVNTLE